MASKKQKEPEKVYFIKIYHPWNNTFTYKGPYAGKRPIKEGEELIEYKLSK